MVRNGTHHYTARQLTLLHLPILLHWVLLLCKKKITNIRYTSNNTWDLWEQTLATLHWLIITCNTTLHNTGTTPTLCCNTPGAPPQHNGNLTWLHILNTWNIAHGYQSQDGQSHIKGESKAWLVRCRLRFYAANRQGDMTQYASRPRHYVHSCDALVTLFL